MYQSGDTCSHGRGVYSETQPGKRRVDRKRVQAAGRKEMSRSAYALKFARNVSTDKLLFEQLIK